MEADHGYKWVCNPLNVLLFYLVAKECLSPLCFPIASSKAISLSSFTKAKNLNFYFRILLFLLESISQGQSTWLFISLIWNKGPSEVYGTSFLLLNIRQPLSWPGQLGEMLVSFFGHIFCQDQAGAREK